MNLTTGSRELTDYMLWSLKFVTHSEYVDW